MVRKASEEKKIKSARDAGKDPVVKTDRKSVV